MRHWTHLVLAIVVIVGWFMALTWLLLAVSQIAVQQAVTPSLCVVAGAGEVACSP